MPYDGQSGRASLARHISLVYRQQQPSMPATGAALYGQTASVLAITPCRFIVPCGISFGS